MIALETQTSDEIDRHTAFIAMLLNEGGTILDNSLVISWCKKNEAQKPAHLKAWKIDLKRLKGEAEAPDAFGGCQVGTTVT